MTLVCYDIAHIDERTPYNYVYSYKNMFYQPKYAAKQVDGLSYPITVTKHLGNLYIQVLAPHYHNFNRCWNIFDSEDTIRK